MIPRYVKRAAAEWQEWRRKCRVRRFVRDHWAAAAAMTAGEVRHG